MFRLFFLLFIFTFAFFGSACSVVAKPQSIPMTDLSGSSNYSEHVKKLISRSMLLSKKELNYRFGSGDPKNGGMDCSGTIHYLLKKVGHINSPRDARDLYLWVKKDGRLHPVHAYHFNSRQFSRLKPGDLLFWTGTYRTRRKPPITHVMLYIGKNKRHQRLMFGATEGIYRGRIVRGVGVFDFVLPTRHERARFVAYGCIPHYTCSNR
ncbi:MAG: NlpC/P60 family protein [Gammaproteobacteria bacterium]|nr:NlpC/P60 family protein [Gammaproteobacteria bacterium]